MERSIETLLKYGKRIDNYEGLEIDINSLSYAFVKNDFLEMINDGEVREAVKESLVQLFKLTEEDLNNLDDKYILGVFAYLYDQILTDKGIISIQERTFLASKPDPKMIASGQSSLEPFAYKHTLYHLANKNPLAMEKISQMKYGEILDIQVINKRENDIKEKYTDLVKNSK